MSAKYKFIDHTADIACEVSGDSLEELFTASAEAWRASVVEETKYCERELKNFELKALSIEQLLVDFVSELNFYLFTKKWLFNMIHKLEIKNDKITKLPKYVMDTRLLYVIKTNHASIQSFLFCHTLHMILA
jgi:SHS2 domain-containing protein